MGIDEEIKNRLDGSLRTVMPPSTRPDAVIRRARSLRFRHRAIGLSLTALSLAAVIAPLLLLWPLGARDDRSDVGPATEPGRLAVSAQVSIGPGITDVASGFGSVWTTGNTGVARVEPSTHTVIAEVPVAGTGDYSHIAVGEGSVWVTAPELRPDGSRGTLVRIDPASNTIAASIHIGGPIQDVAVGAGSVWVTRPEGRSSTILRVDATSEQVVGTVPTAESAGSVVFGEGSLWVTNTGGTGSVARIDPATEAVVDTLDAPSVQAVGDGSLWGVTGDSVLRIRPDSGTVEATIPVPRAQEVAVFGSSVWVLAGPRSSDPMLFEPIAGTARVSRIDPTTDRVVDEPAALQDLQPIALTVDELGAWVVDYYDGNLSLITWTCCGGTEVGYPPPPS